MAEGITFSGLDAETMFCAATGALLAAKHDGCDATVDGHPVEIKYASTSNVNQVRATRYIPLVVCTPAVWYVIPAHHVARIVAQRPRGQHTSDPFESCGFSLNPFSSFIVNPVDLREAVLDAVRESDAYEELRSILEAHQANVERLVVDTKERVWAALDIEDPA